MAWADNMRCEHGMTFNQECDYCEMVGLKESLSWMKRRVLRDEKRLEKLQDKLNPLNKTK